MAIDVQEPALNHRSQPTGEGYLVESAKKSAWLVNGPPVQAPKEPANLTLVLHHRHRLALEERPPPPRPAPNEVTLATHSIGICGSDIKYWQDGRIADLVVREPLVLGHETSAVVREVGANVSSLRPGDRVAVEVGLPCSSCAVCRQGRYNLCQALTFAGTPPQDGNLRRFFNHPADFCHKLPERISMEEAALLEPLAVAVHACRRAPIQLDDIVLVCGSGPVGILCMASALAFGASHVIVTDIMESRLEFARRMGASATFLATKGMSPEELAAQVLQFTRTKKPEALGVDVVLECSGAEHCVQTAISAAGIGATIVCVGCQPDAVSIPMNRANFREIDIKGVYRYRNCYPLAMSLVAAGKVQLGPLVTHRFPLERALEAFETCRRGLGVKVMIQCLDERRPSE